MRGQGRRRRRRGRRAVRMLEPALLLLLHHAPAHGYALLERLGEFGLGDMNPSAVYRALRDMEEKAWVTSTWDKEQAQGPPRRVYRLTAQLKEGSDAQSRGYHRLQEQWQNHADPCSGP